MDSGELTQLLSEGDRVETKRAVAYIEKLPKITNRRPQKQFREISLWAFQNFDRIKNPANQVAVLHALKLPLMYLGTKLYDQASKFLLDALEHPDGRVREQARYTADWFLTDITPERSPSKSEKKLGKLAGQLFDFAVRLDQAAKNHKPEGKGRLYLNGMKPCPYKTLQIFLRRILLCDWYMRTIRRLGYIVYPDNNDIFSDTYSEFWEVAPHLELHEVEFVVELRKGKKEEVKPKTAYQFKVSFHRNENIYRVIEIDPNLSLHSLAMAITDAFDFDFDHCFGFFNELNERGSPFGSTEAYELFNDLPNVEPTEAGSVKSTKIKDVWKQMRKIMYFLFDYGDNWLFEVDLVGINDKAKLTPRHFFDVIKKVGKAPEQYPDRDEEHGDEE